LTLKHGLQHCGPTAKGEIMENHYCPK